MCESSANCSAVNDPLCYVLMMLYVNFLPLDVVVMLQAFILKF